LKRKNLYGFCEPLAAGDSVFSCAIFGAATSLLATPIRISKTSVLAATRPNTKGCFKPVIGLSAMEFLQLSFVQVADMGGKP
jgi:hypothetical protein